MGLKQISLTMPRNLFEASNQYYKEYGYRNLQEFIIDLIRKKVIMENLSRYKEIEERMKRGIGVKRFSQKEAVNYLKDL